MRIINQILISKIILRNLVFLVMLGASLYFAPKNLAQVLAGQFFFNSLSEDQQIDAKASSFVLGLCSGGYLGVTEIWASAWADERCGPGNPVKNKTRVEEIAGDYYMYQSAISTVMLNGQSMHTVIGSTDCNDKLSKFNTYTPEACDAPVDLGPIDSPPIYNPPYPNYGYGCSYCQANWIFDAACAGPYDGNYCGGYRGYSTL